MGRDVHEAIVSMGPREWARIFFYALSLYVVLFAGCLWAAM